MIGGTSEQANQVSELAHQDNATLALAARASGVNTADDLGWAVVASMVLVVFYIAIKFNGIVNESR